MVHCNRVEDRCKSHTDIDQDGYDKGKNRYLFVFVFIEEYRKSYEDTRYPDIARKCWNI